MNLLVIEAHRTETQKVGKAIRIRAVNICCTKVKARVNTIEPSETICLGWIANKLELLKPKAETKE